MFNRFRTRQPFPAAAETPVNSVGVRTFEGRVLDRQDDELQDQGLVFDLGSVMSRRRLLGVLGVGAGAVALAVCTPGTVSRTTAAPGTTTAAAELTEMKTETAGPYPGDGSNGPDVLGVSGVERSDIRSSIEGETSAAGVPMTLTMTLIDLANDNTPMAGAAVYVWHCDALGRYSMYDEELSGETYLRGVQLSDATGQVTFTSIVPGCYSGRWPHIHFEVFPDAAAITDSTNNILTSQIALPEETSTAVYSTAEYEGSAGNLSRITLDSDNVFSDGWEQQVATVTGDVTTGFTLSIEVPIDPATEQSSSESGPGGPGGPRPGGGAMPTGW